MSHRWIQIEERFAGRHVSTRRFAARRGVRVGSHLSRGVAYAALDAGPEAADEGPQWLVEPGGRVPVAAWMERVEAGALTDATVGQTSWNPAEGPVCVWLGQRCFVVTMAPAQTWAFGLRSVATTTASNEAMVLGAAGIAAATLAAVFLVYVSVLDRPAPDDLRAEARRGLANWVAVATPAPALRAPRPEETAASDPPSTTKKPDPPTARPARAKARPKPRPAPVEPTFKAVAAQPRRVVRRAPKTPEVAAPRPLPRFASTTGAARRAPRGRTPAPGPPPGRGASPTFASTAFAPSSACIQKAVRGMNAALRRCAPGVTTGRASGFSADCRGGQARRKGLSFRCGGDLRCSAAEVRGTLQSRATRTWWRGICGG